MTDKDPEVAKYDLEYKNIDLPVKLIMDTRQDHNLLTKYTSVNIKHAETVNIDYAHTLNIDTVREINCADRDVALNLIAQLKVAHDIDNHTLGLACAELRVPLGNKL